ncbi:MAG TPA: hypothetical protein VGC42_20410 [Kofleriaceae bacterium]
MPSLRKFVVLPIWGAGLLLAAAATAAHADPALLASQWVTAAEPELQIDNRWPAVPDDHGPSLEDQLTRRIDALGQRWSRDSFQLVIASRHRRARLHIGNGSGDAVSLQVLEDIQFDDADTYVHTTIDLRIHDRHYQFSLPAVEMSPVSYRGDYGVEIKLPLLKRKF